MQLPPEEPPAGPWEVRTRDELLQHVLRAAGDPTGRPRVVAVDGRSASGKSTLAADLHGRVAASAVVHTDDLAWHEPLFGWGHLLVEVLSTVRSGRAVSFRPPQWSARGRDESIEVPAGLEVVFVEGVGAGQRAVRDLVDATVWVQSDLGAAYARGIDRDVENGSSSDIDDAVAFWEEWSAAEMPFLAADRPWERACVVVDGTPDDLPDGDVVRVAVPARAGQWSSVACESVRESAP